jgi:hypothetical protein
VIRLHAIQNNGNNNSLKIGNPEWIVVFINVGKSLFMPMEPWFDSMKVNQLLTM